MSWMRSARGCTLRRDPLGTPPPTLWAGSWQLGSGSGQIGPGSWQSCPVVFPSFLAAAPHLFGAKTQVSGSDGENVKFYSAARAIRKFVAVPHRLQVAEARVGSLLATAKLEFSR